jgi:hypothetical protein
MSNWISVRDRLPAFETDVIVNVVDGTDAEGVGSVFHAAFGFDGKYGFYYITNNGISDISNEVSHWMPLPEPIHPLYP